MLKEIYINKGVTSKSHNNLSQQESWSMIWVLETNNIVTALTPSKRVGPNILKLMVWAESAVLRKRGPAFNFQNSQEKKWVCWKMSDNKTLYQVHEYVLVFR